MSHIRHTVLALTVLEYDGGPRDWGAHWWIRIGDFGARPSPYVRGPKGYRSCAACWPSSLPGHLHALIAELRAHVLTPEGVCTDYVLVEYGGDGEVCRVVADSQSDDVRAEVPL